MTTIDDAISAIQAVQNDLGNIINFLQSYQTTNFQGIPINTTALKTIIQTLATKLVTDIQKMQPLISTAVQGL